MADSYDRQDNEHSAQPEQRRFLQRAVLFDGVAVLFLLGLAAFWYASHALLLVFAGILFSILLHELSTQLQHRANLPQGLSLGLVVLALLLLILLAGWTMAPQISQQATELAKLIPQALQRVRDAAGQSGILGQLAAALPPTEKIGSQLSAALPKAGLFFTGVLGVLGNIVIIAFVGIYFAAQPRVYINGLVSLMPQRKRQRAREVMDEIGRTLAQWLLGKALSMVAVGLVTGIALMLLDIPLALSLGLLAGLLDFIPYIGPIVAGVPAVLIAYSESPALALYVGLLFLAIQIAEGYLLIPLVERRTVSLPPALTIVMQVLMGTFFGFAGIALATPLTAVLAVLVIMLYQQDVLGDAAKTPSER